MEISKIKAIWALVTGGFAGLAVYLLEAVNKWFATLSRDKFARAASIVRAIANAISILIETFLPAKYVDAANKTLDALNTLAMSLEDGEVTKDELDADIDAVEAAIAAWKKAC